MPVNSNTASLNVIKTKNNYCPQGGGLASLWLLLLSKTQHKIKQPHTGISSQEKRGDSCCFNKNGNLLTLGNYFHHPLGIHAPERPKIKTRMAKGLIKRLLLTGSGSRHPQRLKFLISVYALFMASVVLYTYLSHGRINSKEENNNIVEESISSTAIFTMKSIDYGQSLTAQPFSNRSPPGTQAGNCHCSQSSLARNSLFFLVLCVPMLQKNPTSGCSYLLLLAPIPSPRAPHVLLHNPPRASKSLHLKRR